MNPLRATKTEPVSLPKPGIMALSVHAAVCQFHLFPPAPPATPSPAPELQLIATDPAPVAMVQVDQVTEAPKLYGVYEAAMALGIGLQTFKRRVKSGLYEDFDFTDGKHRYWFEDSISEMRAVFVPPPNIKPDKDGKGDLDKEPGKPTMLTGVVTVDSLGLAACANPGGRAIYRLGRVTYEAKAKRGEVSYYVDGWPCDTDSLNEIFDNIDAGQAFRVAA